MSTRAQVRLTDGKGDELWFYRHCDGYPAGVMPTLTAFMDRVKAGTIRDNVEQAGGWLILLGAAEYNVTATSTDWKCGAYEPCSCGGLHGDVEYLYTVSLKDKTITVEEV